jgi:hypothetical protein
MKGNKMNHENPDCPSANETTAAMGKLLQFPSPSASDQERIDAFRCAAEMLLRAADELEKSSRRGTRLR